MMKKKRNGRIDFLRFVFALIIVLHHTRYLLGYEHTIFIGGSLGVEFFFLVSGYLLVATVERVAEQNHLAGSLGTETLIFLQRKVLRSVFQVSYPFTLLSLLRMSLDNIFFAESSGYSQSDSLRSSTPNNCSAVYQEELSLLLIQASPHPLLIAFRNLSRGLT